MTGSFAREFVLEGNCKMKKTSVGLALALLIAAGSVQADGCTPGPEGNRCKAENGDPAAMYLVGREAYDEARNSGDFSEAYMWATRARNAGFLGGKMLFKMIHLQAGQGAHHDNVEAHGWISTAIADGADYLVPWKRRLEAIMTREQLAEARRIEADQAAQEQ
jgi:TPR repeat protein